MEKVSLEVGLVSGVRLIGVFVISGSYDGLGIVICVIIDICFINIGCYWWMVWFCFFLVFDWD